MAEPPIAILKAIAHSSRYAILASLSGGERNVGEIQTVTNIGQPALSQQLSVLRKAGLVSTRREAKLVYYSLENNELAKACALLDALTPPVTNNSVSVTKAADLGGAAVFARLD